MNIEQVFQAVRLNNLELYFKLIELDSVDMVNEFGQNLLFEAVVNHRVAIGKDLILRGIDLDHKDRNGQCILHYAALHKEEELAKSVLKKGGDVNIKDVHGNSALWTAVFNAKGSYSIVRLFLESGADPTHKNNSGRSAIDFATQIGDVTLVNLLTAKL